MALITTIIPTFKRPRLVSRAIQSSLGQTFTDLEVLVLDNASGDETASVVAAISKADPRVKYHCHSENVGGMKNLLYGLSHITTPFFSILSDDDILLPEFYAAAMKGFNDHPSASFVACGTLHITPAGDYYGMPVAQLPVGFYQPPEGLLAILRYGHPEWTGMLFRTSIVSEIGSLDDRTGYAADFDFELRAASRTSFVVCHQPAAIYSTQPLNRETNGTYPFDGMWPTWPRLIQNIMDDPHLSDHVKQEARERLENRFRDGLLLLGLRYLYQNKTEDAQKAQRVLGQEFKCIIQAGFLKACINIHHLMGPKMAATMWSLCRILWIGSKVFRPSADRAKRSEAELLSVAPYRKFMQIPNQPTNGRA
jgi:glycosyltransferase involved in cell wall biosynthesis